nr:MAG TPA: hypothetical protein [Caudoviricetes sp.]DAX63251.1 MAG TPA: hypothetical protein [Caudoviricetes sp.]
MNKYRCTAVFNLLFEYIISIIEYYIYNNLI